MANDERPVATAPARARARKRYQATSTKHTMTPRNSTGQPRTVGNSRRNPERRKIKLGHARVGLATRRKPP
eukprot:13155877-Alexandrium_andersonii.AAC.1